jgi:hypothetical protein
MRERFEESLSVWHCNVLQRTVTYVGSLEDLAKAVSNFSVTF